MKKREECFEDDASNDIDFNIENECSTGREEQRNNEIPTTAAMDQPDWDWKSTKIHTVEEFLHARLSCSFRLTWTLLMHCALLLNITGWGKMRGVHIWDMIMTHGMGLFWLLRIMKWMMIMWRLPILDLFLSLSLALFPLPCSFTFHKRDLRPARREEEKNWLCNSLRGTWDSHMHCWIPQQHLFRFAICVFFCNSRNKRRKEEKEKKSAASFAMEWWDELLAGRWWIFPLRADSTGAQHTLTHGSIARPWTPAAESRRKKKKKKPIENW